ncbi:MAG: cytidylyltransferase family-domain-containing protein [Monoraphidium minutum]|nr:MAG: cytidylyltransferase family-domain-containing protein [Monoraphidium minutum]
MRRPSRQPKSSSEDGFHNSFGNASDRGESDRDEGPPPVEDPGKRLRSFKTRTVSTFAMIASFAFIVYLGHVPLVLLVLTLQFLMVGELFHLARVSQKENYLPGFRAQQWYFFAVAAFYLYVRFIKNNLLVELAAEPAQPHTPLFSWVLRRHNLISYLLYMAGFVAFVLSLKRGMYMYQFGQYAWTHMILLIVFVPSSFFVSNVFEGLVWFLLPSALIIVNDIMAYLAAVCLCVWFLLPSALIIVNDIMAYLAGFFFGRTPLIKLSPKKTWEGFVGGVLGTVVAGYFMAAWFSRFKWMTCPRQDLSFKPLDCEPDDIFKPQLFNPEELSHWFAPPIADAARHVAAVLPPSVRAALGGWSFVAAPMQIHAAVLAVFASFVAPFGGFFASGFKRAFKMKDFGDTIPGHGGVTDRFDCMMIMAMFAYLYYWTFVARTEPSVGHVLEVAQQLAPAQQLELLALLSSILLADGGLPPAAAAGVRALMGAVIAKTSALNPVAGYNLSAGGLEWAYRRGEVEGAGAGTADVLLLHGLGSSSYSYRNTLALLGGAGVTAVAPDWPGHGDSGKPGRGTFGYTEADYTAALSAFVGALDIRKPLALVVQGSVLSQYALLWALDNPGLVERLVILNTPLAASNKLRPELAAYKNPIPFLRPKADAVFDGMTFNMSGSPYAMMEADALAYGRPYRESPAASAAVWATMDAMPAWGDLVGRIDEGFRRWKQPSLLLFGSNDPFVDTRSAFDFLETKRTTMKTTTIAAKLGHMPQEDFAEALHEPLLGFLRGEEPKAAKLAMRMTKRGLEGA